MGQGRLIAGAVQFSGAPREKERNIETATRLIRQAAGLGAQIVMTPEVVLSGFIGGDEERKLAESIPGPATEHFCRIAKELGVYVLVGMSELNKGEIMNAMPVIAPDGKLEGVFRKVHINKFEIPGGWRNGSAFPVWHVETATGSAEIGIMICYDREMPESARILMVKGADVIFNPLACKCPTVDIHRCLLRTRAFENEVYIFMVNQAAPAQNGHSMVFDFNGDIVHEAGEGEEVFIHTLDIDTLNTYRETSFYGLHHRRPELYGPLTDPAGQIHSTDANLPPMPRKRLGKPSR